nr:tRNA lysidine(34) synthetase TilS [Polymorphobacter sp.]
MPDLAALLAAALDRPLTPAEPLAVAVSGGPDSVALLLLAATAFPGRVTALTVDHGLRPASAVEAATVAHHCALAGIPHITLHWAGPKPTANLQSAARTARYALMADWCAAHAVPLLLTAHHADDQAETLLMRLARSSGSAGLSGIRATRDLGQGVALVRPLLTTRRATLAVIAADSGWALADDPANRDPRYARTHARRLLAATVWLEPARLAEAAAHLAAAESALAWTTDRAWAGRATCTASAIHLDTIGLPAEITRRLTIRAITCLAPVITPRGPDITRLMARLHTGGTATLAGVKARGGAPWHFSVAAKCR